MLSIPLYDSALMLSALVLFGVVLILILFHGSRLSGLKKDYKRNSKFFKLLLTVWPKKIKINFKKTEEVFFRVLTFLSTCLIILILLLLIYGIFHKGLPSLSWEMLTSTPKGGFYWKGRREL